ncbi:MAG: hypothetical protein WCP96_06435 [Methylococcaceae bacterium]
MQALRNRVESLRNYVAYPLLGMQRVEQDGWGGRRHKRSRDFCRLLGRDAHKSFRKNSDSPIMFILNDHFRPTADRQLL